MHNRCSLEVFADWNLAFDALFERDKRLSRYYTGNALYLVVEQIHQLFVVLCKEFDEHSVRTCGEMAFYHLGNRGNTLHNIAIH